MKLAAIQLEGRALLWHQNYIKGRGNQTPSWDQYALDITTCFDEVFDDPMSDLKALKQDQGSVQTYHDEFDALASKLELSEGYLLSCFIRGLNESFQIKVRMFSPTSVQQAYCLAKLKEAANKAIIIKNQTKPPLLPTQKPQNKAMHSTAEQNKKHFTH